MTTKYVIIIPDGAADEPLKQLGNKTVLEVAETPNMDKISTQGRQGLVRTIPEGMEPGSDVAQMSLLGYDPRRYYTGRAPIEAVSTSRSCAFLFLRGLWQPRRLARWMIVVTETWMPFFASRSRKAE